MSSRATLEEGINFLLGFNRNERMPVWQNYKYTLTNAGMAEFEKIKNFVKFLRSVYKVSRREDFAVGGADATYTTCTKHVVWVETFFVVSRECAHVFSFAVLSLLRFTKINVGVFICCVAKVSVVVLPTFQSHGGAVA